MKPLSMAALAAGMLVLSACGGSQEANLAADNAADESLNALPEDLGDENLLGEENLLGNEADLNAADAGNAADANASVNSQY